MIIARRALLLGATAALTGCDRLARNETVRNALFSAENFHKWAQRSLMARDALALELARLAQAPSRTAAKVLLETAPSVFRRQQDASAANGLARAIERNAPFQPEGGAYASGHGHAH